MLFLLLCSRAVGAPLSAETHEQIRTCLCVDVTQGNAQFGFHFILSFLCLKKLLKGLEIRENF